MTEYNGWTNFETFVVENWYSNDEANWDQVEEMTLNAWKEASIADFNRSMEARLSLADHLKEVWDEKLWYSIPSNLQPFVDLVTAALNSVNWDEIADAWLSTFVPGYYKPM